MVNLLIDSGLKKNIITDQTFKVMKKMGKLNDKIGTYLGRIGNKLYGSMW